MRSCIALSCALIWVVLANSAFAQDDDLEAVLACDKIEEPADRLKCFDTVVESLKQKGAPSAGTPEVAATAPAEPAPAPPPPPPPTPEELFGDPPPPKPTRAERVAARAEGRPAQPERPKKLREITSGVRRFWRNNDGDYVIVLENGQIWQALDASSLSIPQDPLEATIKRGLLGGYKMTIRNKSRRGFSGKVKRIR